MKNVLKFFGVFLLVLSLLALLTLMCMRLYSADKENYSQDVSETAEEEEPAHKTWSLKKENKETEPADSGYLISFIGDCTLASSQYNNDFINRINGDYTYPFRNTKEIFAADDLTIANLECTFSDRVSGMTSDGTFAFKAPASYANILVEGNVDFVTTANNHRDDFADNGRVDTDAALDAVGMAHAGDNETYMAEVDGHKIGIYCAYNHLSPNDELTKNAIDALRSDGAEIVICAFHWGKEGSYQLTDTQEQMGHRAIELGADVVYGSHPHVLQKIERYQEGLILYSMGNFSFGGNTNPRDRDTAIVQIRLVEDDDGKLALQGYEVTPCCLSSTDGINDYCPMPYEKGTEGYARVFSKLNGIYDGPDLSVDYSSLN